MAKVTENANVCGWKMKPLIAMQECLLLKQRLEQHPNPPPPPEENTCPASSAADMVTSFHLTALKATTANGLKQCALRDGIPGQYRLPHDAQNNGSQRGVIGGTVWDVRTNELISLKYIMEDALFKNEENVAQLRKQA